MKKFLGVLLCTYFLNGTWCTRLLLRLLVIDMPMKVSVSVETLRRLDIKTRNEYHKSPDSKLKNVSLIEEFKSLEQFGAKGDGKTDDTQAIIKALNSPVPVVYAQKSKSYYKVSDKIVVSNINKKKLIATGAVFLNSDLTKATFFFQRCNNIKIYGGKYGYVNTPNTNGNGSQHVFQFDDCQDVLLNNIHVKNSPEMGIAITNSNRVTVKNSRIEHTFRDGTYSHYSANVNYLYNTYSNIKDDAMSFHDYGLDEQKKPLLKYGYKQATNLLAQGNIVKNCYQGFGSIGSSNVSVLNNKFTNTVIAAISIFNAQEMYPGGNASAKKCLIQNNVITNACTTASINEMSYSNYGQASTGRAAICILSLGARNQLNQGETKRLSTIKVIGNTINGSGANGFFANLVDNLHITNNKFMNCSGAVPQQSLNGDVVEVWNCTALWANANTVIDTRKNVLHQHGYAFNNVSGRMSGWNVKGVLRGESMLDRTQSLQIIHNRK
ncbi:right-handed parallel beta-helix repeat-containing protein [Spirosoma fluviale]|uniref:Right handed beta helix region n=1 Tax=Spirosoma fluviale TaxID=1597977 RepID=A0A286GHR7_9BACT|nr:right-handed parallel beta-helix repeat-containing protein [Spirosoma fluviale]SOD95073.1 Right handed beta helix region [Spirosoma fluviale]